MLMNEIFIFKTFSIDWLTTSAIVICEITTLGHKSRNYSMELTVFEMESLLWFFTKTFVSNTKWSEVFRSFGSVQE